MLFIPAFSRADFVSENPVLVSIFAKSSDATSSWSKNISMGTGEEYDFLATVKSYSSFPLADVNLEIKIPDGVLYKGYIFIDGAQKTADISKPINIGTLAEGGEKAITFQAKSVSLDKKQLNENISATIQYGDLKTSDSLAVVLKPYNFQGIKIAKSVGLATAGFSARQWYLWVIFAVALIIYFFRLFLRLFSAPMG